MVNFIPTYQDLKTVGQVLTGPVQSEDFLRKLIDKEMEFYDTITETRFTKKPLDVLLAELEVMKLVYNEEFVTVADWKGLLGLQITDEDQATGWYVDCIWSCSQASNVIFDHVLCNIDGSMVFCIRVARFPCEMVYECYPQLKENGL